MRRNSNINQRLGQTNNLVTNTEDERMNRIHRLLRIDNEENCEPRNRQERRLQGNYSPTNINHQPEENGFSIRGGSGNQLLYSVDVSNFPGDYFAQWGMGMGYSAIGIPRTENYKYIHSFNYTPSEFNFHKINNEKDNLFLGFELEIDKGGKSDETAKYIQDFLGEDNCYIVSDGTLSDGMEIVSHPMTLSYHKSQPYKELFNELISKNYKSHETTTCGLHIHFNKNFFGDDINIQELNCAKVLYLLCKLHKEVKIISRRDEGSYNNYQTITENTSIFDLMSYAKSNKYSVGNMKHKSTMEIRAFKGTLKYETLVATLEFVRNLAYVAKDVSLEELNTISIMDVINKFDNEYLTNYYLERLKKKNKSEWNKIKNTQRQLVEAI